MIRINLDKARQIAHDLRRQKRAEEMAPLDMKTLIPTEAEKAEAERQKLREKYAVAQVEIDKAGTVDDLKAVVESL